MKVELTGAPNRRAVVAIGQAQWALCRRLGMTLGVAIIDLDHFKRVNDGHGHGVGDNTLRSFAAMALKALREQDRIGRYGGEEWLLVMLGAGADRRLYRAKAQGRNHLVADDR